MKTLIPFWTIQEISFQNFIADHFSKCSSKKSIVAQPK